MQSRGTSACLATLDFLGPRPRQEIATARGRDSFFLWGLRQAGKSSLLKETYPNSVRIDLLKASERLPLQARPEFLVEMLRAENLLDSKCKSHGPVIIDEVQKIHDHGSPKAAWRAYVQDYIKEEILEEGLVRSLPPLSRILELASLSDTEIVSWQSFARDVGVSAEGVKGYFDILCDTNVGSFLPAYQVRPKRRTRLHPKFYFSDVG